MLLLIWRESLFLETFHWETDLFFPYNSLLALLTIVLALLIVETRDMSS